MLGSKRLTMLPACVLVCGAHCAVARWHEDWTYGTAIHPNFMRGYANLVVLDVARIGLALVVAMLYPVVGECTGRGQCAGDGKEEEEGEEGSNVCCSGRVDYLRSGHHTQVVSGTPL